MSRIGKKPIPIPKGVTVKIAPDAVEVQGPKGKLRQPLPPGILFSRRWRACGQTLTRGR
jgi:large subunit ribosomal protein L6